MGKFKTFRALPVFISLFVVGCSSSSTDTINTDPAANEPAFSGEFHSIQPEDVDAYVANFESQIQRTGLTLDGIEYELSNAEQDTENGFLIFSFNDDMRFIYLSFDFDNDEPLPEIQIISSNDVAVALPDLSGFETGIQVVQSTEDDIVYSGRVTNAQTQEEFDVTVTINESLLGSGSSTLVVSGADAILNGDVGTKTYVQMRNMIAANPLVTRVVLQNSSGSVNDDINVHTGRLIRNSGLATHVPANGDINSGAVDLFAAGLTRTVDEGGILGVHSWCCNDAGLPGDRIPRSSQDHGTQLTYFREMLADQGEDFYFFTLQAAPFDGIHPMTRAEMITHGLIQQ